MRVYKKWEKEENDMNYEKIKMKILFFCQNMGIRHFQNEW